MSAMRYTAEQRVDQLARVLASVNEPVTWDAANHYWRCAGCQRWWRSTVHAADCPYIWAVNHVKEQDG